MLVLDEDINTGDESRSDTLIAREYTVPATPPKGVNNFPLFSYCVDSKSDVLNRSEEGLQGMSSVGEVHRPPTLSLTPPTFINKIDMECFPVFSGPESSVMLEREWVDPVMDGAYGECAMSVEHTVTGHKLGKPHTGSKQGMKFVDEIPPQGEVPFAGEGSKSFSRSNSARPPHSIPKIRVWGPPVMTGLEEHSFPTLSSEILVVEIPSVVYDEETRRYELFHSVAISEEDSEQPPPPMAVNGTLNGSPVHILAPDSGCNTQVVSESFCIAHGIPTYLLSQSLGIKYSNGTTETGMRRTADLTLIVQDYKTTVRLNVVKEIAGYDIILGTPFFIKHKAKLDFSLSPRRVTFSAPPGEWLYDNKFRDHEVNFIDVLRPDEQKSFLAQAKKAGCQVFLLDIKEILSSFPTEEKRPEGAVPLPVVNGVPRKMSDDPKTQAVYEKFMAKELFVDKPPKTLPPTRDLPSGGSHKIILKSGAEIPNKRGFRMSHGETILLNQKILELVDAGYVGPSMSEFGAPALLVAKPNGNGYRLVIDYRELNAATVPKSMVPPDIRQLFDTLRDCETFSVCDLFNGFYAMPIDPESRHRTAFVANGIDGKSHKWEWRVLPLGLNNSPASFQTMMDEILQPINTYVTAYIDDLIIFTRKGQDHAEALDKVFTVLDKQQIKLNINKCFLGKTSVKFLGFQLSKNLITPDPAKTEAINLYPEPTNLKELRRFIGMCNYLYSFVDKFSTVAAPLVSIVNHAVKLGSKGIVWTESARKSFETLKAAIVAAPGLMIPDLKKQFQVSADSCGLGMGGSLWQKNDESGQMTPIAFISQKYTDAIMNYSIQERELYASVLCFKKWYHYLALASLPTLIISDHESLQSFVTHKDLHQGGQGRRPRWAEFLGKFQFIQQYHSGASPELATPDAISRVFENPLAQPSEPMGSNCDLDINLITLEVNSLRIVPLEIAALAASIEEDPKYTPLFELYHSSMARLDQDWLLPLLQFLEKDPFTARLLSILDRPASEVNQHDRSYAKRYSLIDGFLYFNDERGTRLVIPETPGLFHRSTLIQESHDTNMSGHFSVEKTYGELSRFFYWPSQYSDVVQYVARCDRCLRDKHSTAKPLGLLSAYSSDELYPFHTWAIDEITELPLTKLGHNACLICTERVIGTVVLIPTKKTNSAVDDALQFFLKVVCRYGMVHEIHSDRLPKYTSVFWVTLFKLAGTKLKFSTSHYKATQGQAERRNQTVETLFRHMITPGNLNEWENICPVLEFQVNNVDYKPTGVAPNEAMFGRILDTPMAWLSTAESRKVMVPAVKEFAEKQAALFQRCKDALRAASDSQLEKLNAKRRSHTYVVGDKVLLWAKHVNAVHRPHKYPKFLAPYMGYSETEPFTIVQVVSDSVMKLKLPLGMERARVFDEFPVKYLKPYPKEDPSALAHPVVDEPPVAEPIEDVPAVTVPDGFFIVEKIVKAEKTKGDGQLRYLVKFLGYPDSDNQWVTRKSLTALAREEADKQFPEFIPVPRVKKVREAKAEGPSDPEVIVRTSKHPVRQRISRDILDL